MRQQMRNRLKSATISDLGSRKEPEAEEKDLDHLSKIASSKPVVEGRTSASNIKAAVLPSVA